MKILVVEDNPQVAETIMDYLELAGHRLENARGPIRQLQDPVEPPDAALQSGLGRGEAGRRRHFGRRFCDAQVRRRQLKVGLVVFAADLCDRDGGHHQPASHPKEDLDPDHKRQPLM